MEIDEALAACLSGMSTSPARLVALAASLARREAGSALPDWPPLRPEVPGEDRGADPAWLAARNRGVLAESHAVLSQTLRRLGQRRSS